MTGVQTCALPILILWDRETAQPVRRFRGHTNEVLAVAISPDGRRGLSGGGDTVVRLWDLEGGDTIREFRGHTEWIFSVAFSPDGRQAYSASGGFFDHGWQDGTDSAIRVWNLETGQEVRKLEGHKGIVWSVAFSPDGRHVLSGGHDMGPILWDAQTRAEIRRTSAPVMESSACNTRSSRVYSSTSVSHLRGRPLTVLSCMKSQVQMSFLHRAGCWTQLLALVPRFGPNFLGFLSRKGRLSPSSCQSLRTRFMLTDQPRRTSTAWTRR